MPAPLPQGMRRVEDGGDHVRLLLPRSGRNCAPCLPESNLCCGGPVHIRPAESFLFANSGKATAIHPWLRARISPDSWTDFVEAYDAANLQGAVPCSPCVLCPCVCPLFLCQPIWCCLPFQYVEAKRMQRENALNLAMAKYNRYLFNPRGLMARRQVEWRSTEKDGSGDKSPYWFLRFDVFDSDFDCRDLEDGIRAGTHRYDVPEISREVWLSNTPFAVDCQYFTCLIPSPRYFYGGDEPEIEDPLLESRYALRPPWEQTALLPELDGAAEDAGTGVLPPDDGFHHSAAPPAGSDGATAWSGYEAASPQATPDAPSTSPPLPAAMPLPAAQVIPRPAPPPRPPVSPWSTTVSAPTAATMAMATGEHGAPAANAPNSPGAAAQEELLYC